MTNRNPVKQLFITFPHSTLDKSEFRDLLLRFEPDYYKICEEKHKDGTPHLHAVIRFKNKYSKAKVLSYFKEKLPNDNKRIDVEPVRSIKKSLEYLSKEDPHPLESGEFQSNRNPQRNWLDKCAREFGYDNTTHLLQSHIVEEEMRRKITEYMYQEFGVQRIIHIMEMYEYEKHIHFISLLNNRMLKDDMTFFINEFNIKVN